jgi:hypothetical protein
MTQPVQGRRLLAVLVPLGAAILSALAGSGSAAAAGGSVLDEEVRRVSAEISHLRGKAFRNDVPARTMSCANASMRLLEIARAEGARSSPDIERAVAALGFIERDSVPVAPPAPAPGQERADRSARPGADADSEDVWHPCGLAFYDQIRKEVVVVDGRSSIEERSEVLAHELSHALQDQCFDLRARLRSVTRTTSGDHDAEELAVNAAINEGEATAIELLYLWKAGADRSWIQGVGLDDPLAETSRMLGFTPPGERERRLAGGMHSILHGARVAWKQQLRLGARLYFHALARFQYLAGCTFVAEAYRRGGWEMVDRLRDSPPSSTAQLLHPEKYFDDLETPTVVLPSDLLSGRGDALRLLYENHLGELGTEVATEGEAPGWRGDTYRVYGRIGDGTTFVEARSLWQSPAAALQFVARSSRWLRSMNLVAGTFDVIERRGNAVVLGGGIREDELALFRDASWHPRAGDAIAGAGKDCSSDRTVGLRRRGLDGQPTCELRILEPSERSKALEILKAHTDRTAHGSIETDGHSWGLRSRPGGGVSWVEERADGRIVVATGQDRSSVDATRAALLALAPVKERATPAVETPGER